MSPFQEPTADPPPGIDLSPEQFQREKETLFRRAWLPFCAASRLAEPGRFVSHALGGWPLFAIAGADGVIRAFRNRCRHQNMPLVDQPDGACREIRCRFHGWAYDLAGVFLTAPEAVAPPRGRAAVETHLEPVEVARSGNFVFVRQIASAEPPPRWPAFRWPYCDTVTTDIEANWKSVVESVLAVGGMRFLWPVAFIAEAADRMVVRQIVARSFARTRVLDHLFASSDQPSGSDGLREAAARGKEAAEAYQRALTATPAVPNNEVVTFRRRVAVGTSER